MAEQDANRDHSEEEKLKQLAAQMRAAEYQGLSEEEIQEREQQKEQRKKRNIEILEDTLHILEQGCYKKAGRNVTLAFSQGQMREAQVFLSEDIEQLRRETGLSGEGQTHGGEYVCSCENEDALVLAQKRYRSLENGGESAPKILVLNLASATRPGGQTRDGASAQEEDLCRRTSLLLSLESEDAKRYYDYNSARKTRMGSDAVVFSPYVEVIKDASSELLAEPFPICVMSCAAPMVRLGLEGMSQQEYEEMLYQRIQGMLLVAASQGCRHLILGAFGCGVYGNDSALVSRLFDRAIRDFTYAGQGSGQLFDTIEFAVLCRPGKEYNYREFSKTFSRS
ncbi:MAG: TIGR02452 family protein [Oscillospiraceae bacterium]|nr:TIGR02452 family protein [Oscillospiraceae bacterium]